LQQAIERERLGRGQDFSLFDTMPDWRLVTSRTADGFLAKPMSAQADGQRAVDESSNPNFRQLSRLDAARQLDANVSAENSGRPRDTLAASPPNGDTHSVLAPPVQLAMLASGRYGKPQVGQPPLTIGGGDAPAVGGGLGIAVPPVAIPRPAIPEWW